MKCVSTNGKLYEIYDTIYVDCLILSLHAVNKLIRSYLLNISKNKQISLA